MAVRGYRVGAIYFKAPLDPTKSTAILSHMNTKTAANVISLFEATLTYLANTPAGWAHDKEDVGVSADAAARAIVKSLRGGKGAVTVFRMWSQNAGVRVTVSVDRATHKVTVSVPNQHDVTGMDLARLTHLAAATQTLSGWLNGLAVMVALALDPGEGVAILRGMNTTEFTAALTALPLGWTLDDDVDRVVRVYGNIGKVQKHVCAVKWKTLLGGKPLWVGIKGRRNVYGEINLTFDVGAENMAPLDVVEMTGALISLYTWLNRFPGHKAG